MKKISASVLFYLVTVIYLPVSADAQANASKTIPKYDTIIRKHVTKPIAKPVIKAEPVLPVPEFINQPYYYDKDGNRLIKLESSNAQMVTKKKTLGLKGAKQILTLTSSSSKIRFTSKKDIGFFIKTSGDVIDLTSYIKLYKFTVNNENREAEYSSKEGLLNNSDGKSGKLISINIKPVENSKDVYTIQFSDPLEAGEYGFVWVKNTELKEFTVFTFGIDWKSSD